MNHDKMIVEIEGRQVERIVNIKIIRSSLSE